MSRRVSQGLSLAYYPQSSGSCGRAGVGGDVGSLGHAESEQACRPGDCLQSWHPGSHVRGLAGPQPMSPLPPDPHPPERWQGPVGTGNECSCPRYHQLRAGAASGWVTGVTTMLLTPPHFPINLPRPSSPTIRAIFPPEGASGQPSAPDIWWGRSVPPQRPLSTFLLFQMISSVGGSRTPVAPNLCPCFTTSPGVHLLTALLIGEGAGGEGARPPP